MIEFITENYIQIGTWIGVIVAYIVDRKVRKANVDKVISEAELGKGSAVEQIQKVYAQFVADRTAEYTSIITDNKSITERVKELEERERVNARERGELSGKIEFLEKQLEKDKATIDRLQKVILKYEAEILEYKKTLEKYKKS